MLKKDFIDNLEEALQDAVECTLFDVKVTKGKKSYKLDSYILERLFDHADGVDKAICDLITREINSAMKTPSTKKLIKEAVNTAINDALGDGKALQQALAGRILRMAS